jgi:hypothetical protein
MLGDDVRGGRNLLGAFMPISLETVADVEHSRASTSASVAAPVADGGRLHSFSRLFFLIGARYTDARSPRTSSVDGIPRPSCMQEAQTARAPAASA